MKIKIKEWNLKKPVNDDVKVSKGFYDTSLDDKKLEEALVYFEGVYRPNDGIDYTKDNESFDVLCECKRDCY